jgi:hypothetical protein
MKHFTRHALTEFSTMCEDGRLPPIRPLSSTSAPALVSEPVSHVPQMLLHLRSLPREEHCRYPAEAVARDFVAASNDYANRYPVPIALLAECFLSQQLGRAG